MSLTKKVTQRYLKACSDPAAQEKLYRLYALLDDIDTADDMAKGNDELYRNLVRRHHEQRFDVVPEAEADALYDQFHGRTAGWWAIDPDNLRMVMPAESEYVTGDGPADALDAALDRITDEYQQEWGRQPTVTELDAAWRFVTGPYRAGLLRRMAALGVLSPTDKEGVYHADLAKDVFVHFTPADRAEQVLASGKLLMKPPHKKFGPDAVYAVSTKWGEFYPRVQTTHYGNVPLVGIVFTTPTVPKIGYTEEVVWDRDVVLHNPKVVPYNQAVSLIKAARESINDSAYVLYGKGKTASDAKYKDKKEVKNKDGETVTIYEYSERQVANRHREKSERLDKLMGNIDKLESKLKKDLGSDDTQTRLTALAVALINDTYERVGNDDSADEGHFGVTGWLKKHVSFSNGKAHLKYVGKSGVKQDKTVDDKSLVSALKEAADGKDPDDLLFDCDDCTITSKEVNEYLKPFDVTAKDLRGYHANREMMERLSDIRADGPELPRDRKERDEILKGEFKKALEATSDAVGHEASTLRSQYLVPHLEDSYMKDGTVIESLRKQARLRTASLELERYVRATKTQAEREDEQVEEKLVRRSPKLKPPREDLRDHRIDTDVDEDLEPMDQEGDRDLSLNYKRVASLWLEAADRMNKQQRDKQKKREKEKARAQQEAKRKTLDNKPPVGQPPKPKVPSKEEQQPGTVIPTEDKLRAKNKNDIIEYFDRAEGEEAKAFAEGKDKGGESEDKGAPDTKGLVKALEAGDGRSISQSADALKKSHPELSDELDKHLSAYNAANTAMAKASIAQETATSKAEKQKQKDALDQALNDRDAAIEALKGLSEKKPEAQPQQPEAPAQAPEQPQQPQYTNHPAHNDADDLANIMFNWDGNDPTNLNAALGKLEQHSPETKEVVGKLVSHINTYLPTIKSPEEWQRFVREAYPQLKNMIEDAVKPKGQPQQPQQAPAQPQQPEAPAAPETPAEPLTENERKKQEKEKEKAEKAEKERQKADQEAQVKDAMKSVGLSTKDFEDKTKNLNLTDLPKQAEFAKQYAAKLKEFQTNKPDTELALKSRGKVNVRDSIEEQAHQMAINDYVAKEILNPAKIAGGLAGGLPEGEDEKIKSLQGYARKAYDEMSAFSTDDAATVMQKATKAAESKENTVESVRARKLLAAGYLAHLMKGGSPDDKSLPSYVRDEISIYIPKNSKMLAAHMENPQDLLDIADADLMDSNATKKVREAFGKMSAQDMAQYTKGHEKLSEAYAAVSGPGGEAAKQVLDDISMTMMALDRLFGKTKRNLARDVKQTPLQQADALERESKEIDLPSLLKAAQNDPDKIKGDVGRRALSILERQRKLLTDNGRSEDDPDVQELGRHINTFKSMAQSGNYDSNLRVSPNTPPTSQATQPPLPPHGAPDPAEYGPPPKMKKPEGRLDDPDLDPDTRTEMEGRNPHDVWITVNEEDNFSPLFGAISPDGKSFRYFESPSDARKFSGRYREVWDSFSDKDKQEAISDLEEKGYDKDFVNKVKKLHEKHKPGEIWKAGMFEGTGKFGALSRDGKDYGYFKTQEKAKEWLDKKEDDSDQEASDQAWSETTDRRTSNYFAGGQQSPAPARFASASRVASLWLSD